MANENIPIRAALQSQPCSVCYRNTPGKGVGDLHPNDGHAGLPVRKVEWPMLDALVSAATLRQAPCVSATYLPTP